MKTYIIRRLIQGLLVLILVSLMIFIAMRMLPGDPVLIYISQEDMQTFTDDDLMKLRKQFGLDKPLLVQYVHWVAGLFKGDFGKSMHYDMQVSYLVAKRLPITIHLGILASILSILFGTFSGVVSALRRGKHVDTFVTLFANLGITVPVFWLAIVMIYFFGLKLGWLPVFGYTWPFDDFWMSTKQAIMPVICLAIVPLSGTARQTRSSMLEVINQDYIRTAWAKGLPERDVVFRHAIKNGLIPVVTLIGFNVRYIFGGSVLIETVFNIPGMGRLLVDAVFSQDYGIVQIGTLIIAGVVVITNLLVDLSYGWLDPRVRYN
ncbi:MAG: ABC transporter permease [Deltaproteobacteria bacterium]|nr:ABC transporter permease [Deltaproteobacteria bacterium]